MKIAVIGSRGSISDDYKIICKYMPRNAAEIVSGGAVGIDSLAKKYAIENNLLYKEFLPKYNEVENKRIAPILRNREIVNYSDMVLAFWDGESRGTYDTINYTIKVQKPIKIYILETERKKI